MKWRSASVLFLLMAGNYLLNAISFRMLARGSYVGLGVADAALAWWGFTMLQHVARADTLLEKLFYTAGGIVGSLLGLRFTS